MAHPQAHPRPIPCQGIFSKFGTFSKFWFCLQWALASLEHIPQVFADFAFP